VELKGSANTEIVFSGKAKAVKKGSTGWETPVVGTLTVRKDKKTGTQWVQVNSQQVRKPACGRCASQQCCRSTSTWCSSTVTGGARCAAMSSRMQQPPIDWVARCASCAAVMQGQILFYASIPSGSKLTVDEVQSKDGKPPANGSMRLVLNVFEKPPDSSTTSPAAAPTVGPTVRCCMRVLHVPKSGHHNYIVCL
jgi:hypothetical protein